ncbi:hypothetical protein B0T11DRAFT_46884 [Plectosphaerella cucumerina]|uniref:Uncharacterized protein n=1 Tax=Plectosphaerella cucumerina TaxID=40658 RepID=A0A8K0X4G0_9PEZI|nr:hypothetical protein B0T11DRAFT_46884 [Plectosphaerella cucumerina]
MPWQHGELETKALGRSKEPLLWCRNRKRSTTTCTPVILTPLIKTPPELLIGGDGPVSVPAWLRGIMIDGGQPQGTWILRVDCRHLKRADWISCRSQQAHTQFPPVSSFSHKASQQPFHPCRPDTGRLWLAQAATWDCTGLGSLPAGRLTSGALLKTGTSTLAAAAGGLVVHCKESGIPALWAASRCRPRWKESIFGSPRTHVPTLRSIVPECTSSECLCSRATRHG